MKPALDYPLNIQEPAEREAMRQFAGREMGAAFTAPLGACLLAFALHGKVANLPLMLWLGLSVLFSMVNITLTTLLLRRLESARSRGIILWILPFNLFLEGLSWGIAPLLFAVPGEVGYTLLCMVFLCALASWSLHSLCLHEVSMWSFVVPTLLPVATYQSFMGQGLAQTMGLGAFVILGLTLYYGHTTARQARDGINAMVQSAMLTGQLNDKVADLRTALRAIRQLATRDPLTQCYNRRAMMEHLEREMVSQDRDGRTLGVLLIDADHFKRVNDNHGHLTGDEVLKALTERIKAQLRGNDFLARYGGEEFVCLVHVDNRDKLAQAAERIRASVAASPLLEKPGPLHMTVSIGATLRQTEEVPGSLFARADQALYRAKQAGRNTVELDPSMSMTTLKMMVKVEEP